MSTRRALRPGVEYEFDRLVIPRDASRSLVTRMLVETQGRVERLLLKDDLPLVARLLPDLTRRYAGEFDHLARTDEWRRDDVVDEP